MEPSQSLRAREREMRTSGAPPRERSARRSSSRSRALFIGGAVLGVIVIVLVVSALGGGSKHHTAGATTQSAGGTTTTAASKAKTHHPSSTKPAVPANAAEIQVAVLNATETTGLAHHVSSELQQVGYSQATALGGRPPGQSQQTVVEYATGHRDDAEGVARSLNVSHVQPIETGVTALAPSSSVAVVVGADKASASP